MEKFSTEELKRRAAGLMALGNSPAGIRRTLEGLGASPEQVDEVMAAVETRVQRKEQADSRYLWWLGGIAGALMGIMICGAVLLLGQPQMQAQTNDAAATHSPGTIPPVPVQAQTLLPGLPEFLIPEEIPTDIPPDFMASPPVVVRGGVEAAACPPNELEAAILFGGDPRDWIYDQQTNGWTMTNIGPGVTINVPGGMVAGYMTIVEDIEMVSVDGPAVIENVNFIAISCP